ncbi:hypothetical protein U9M48_007494 [Paspalum notatum var. saurae]|uniref:Uncharacterized protein n=1 Tax=Paspalum notatum var. saurae TaxID=547442 RepID=A0AAQ3SH34_PASNO
MALRPTVFSLDPQGPWIRIGRTRWAGSHAVNSLLHNHRGKVTDAEASLDSPPATEETTRSLAASIQAKEGLAGASSNFQRGGR